MKQKIFFSIVLLVILGGAYYWNTPDGIKSGEPQVTNTPLPLFTSTEAVEEGAAAVAGSPGDTLNEPLTHKIKNYKVGKGAEYRAELEKNPHQTPDTAVVSALELGEIFDGVKNDTDADQAFQFFANCVNNETVVSLQTSCLRYAKRLSENYSSLRALWPSLEASASDEVRDVLKFDQR